MVSQSTAKKSDDVENETPKPAKGSRRPRRGRTELRDGIIAAATRLFADRGYGALTIREIAEEAEIALPVLYRFFVDKRDLYIHCCRAALLKDISDFERSIGDSNDDRETIFRFATSMLRRRMDRAIPHVVTRAIFDGDAEALEDEMGLLFNAGFFKRLLKASAGISSPEVAAQRILTIFALSFSMPKLLPLWEKHIFGGVRQEHTQSADYVLGLVYPDVDWSAVGRGIGQC